MAAAHIMRTFLASLCFSLVIGCSSTAPAPVGQIAVSINGEVHHPSKYFLSQGVSLSEALQRAGGFTEFAYLKRIRITHRDGTLVQCDFRKDGEHFILVDGDQVAVWNNGF